MCLIYFSHGTLSVFKLWLHKKMWWTDEFSAIHSDLMMLITFQIISVSHLRWLYSEPWLTDQAPHSVCKGEARQRKVISVNYVYQGGIVDQLVYLSLCFQISLDHSCPVQHSHYCRCRLYQSVRIQFYSIHFYLCSLNFQQQSHQGA